MDRGAWQATVYGVTKSWTWLSNWAHTLTWKLWLTVARFPVCSSLFPVCSSLFSHWLAMNASPSPYDSGRGSMSSLQPGKSPVSVGQRGSGQSYTKEEERPWLWKTFPACLCVCLSHFSCVRLLATLWTIACQAPLSMGLSRQEYWSGLPCPPPGDLPDPRVEPTSLMSPALTGEIFTTGTTGDAPCRLNLV